MPRRAARTAAPRAARLAAAIAMSAVVVPLGACASFPDATAWPDTPPEDFALAVTLYATEPSPGRPADPAWLVPARYIVEPGGTLRAEVGGGIVRAGVPPVVRRLAPDEAARLYALARGSALADASVGIEIGEVGAVLPPRPPAAAVGLTIDGARRAVLVPLDADGREAAAPVLSELARLCWIAP